MWDKEIQMLVRIVGKTLSRRTKREEIKAPNFLSTQQNLPQFHLRISRLLSFCYRKEQQLLKVLSNLSHHSPSMTQTWPHHQNFSKPFIFL